MSESAEPEGAPASSLRTWIGLALAAAVFAALWIAPLPIEAPAHRLAAVFGAILVLWISEALPIAVSSLFVAPLLVLADVTDAKSAFRHYADPLLYLFVGGFFIAEAMRKHGLDRRVARAIVGSRFVRAIPSRVRLSMLISVALISMWISNTAATAMVLPIGLGLLGPLKKGDRAAAGTVLGLAYAASTGGMGTLVGTPPNLITAGFLQEAGMRFGFVEWFMIGFPCAIATSAAAILILKWMMPADSRAPAEKPAILEPLPPWSRGELVCAISFGLAVIGWTAPGIAQALSLPFADTLEDKLEPGIVAIFAASILFAASDGRGTRVLSWREAVGIDWGTIILFGGGLALGAQLVDTGLAASISRGFIAVTGIRDLWLLTGACCLFTIFFSEICSNTAAANMLVPLVIAIAVELHQPIAPPALAVGIGASCGFMLPIATGPNAIVYSTGRVTQWQMIRVGIVFDVVCALLIFGILRVLCPLFGWA